MTKYRRAALEESAYFQNKIQQRSSAPKRSSTLNRTVIKPINTQTPLPQPTVVVEKPIVSPAVEEQTPQADVKTEPDIDISKYQQTVSNLDEEIIFTPPHQPSKLDDALAWFPKHLNYAGLYYIATLILIAGLWLAFMRYHAEINLIQTVAASENQTLVYDGDTGAQVRNEDSALSGSEVRPSAFDIETYQVGYREARVIRIPKLEVIARVQEVGENDKGAIATPDNIFDVGWYSASDRVGKSRGASFMMGHRMGYTTEGIFYELDKLEIGDLIEVELGSREVIKYRVAEKKLYDVDNVDMQRALSPYNSDKFGLNIMTCVGDYLRDDSTFSERLLIRTEQV